MNELTVQYRFFQVPYETVNRPSNVTLAAEEAKQRQRELTETRYALAMRKCGR